jgi:SNF2 family DNA or RNA helicase
VVAPAPLPISDEYVPTIPPWPWQREAVARARNRDGYGFLMDMRTGKTKTVLDEFGEFFMRNLVDQLLVIAPGGVYRTWETAIEEHVGEPLREHVWVLPWVSGKTGSGKGALRELDAFRKNKNERIRILLVNVEALSTVKPARDLVLDFVASGRTYGVVDESPCIKTPTSKRTKFVVYSVGPQCAVRRILTGLPATRSPLDVFCQFEFLRRGCLGFKTHHEFSNRYAIKERQIIFQGGRRIQFDKIIGFRRQDELADLVARHSYRVRIEDCYDLPEKIYETREVELTDEQDRVYGELLRYATSELSADVHVSAPIAMVRIGKLHQLLCGHVLDEDGTRREVPTRRVEALLDLLDEWDDGKRKAIIWVSYDHDVHAVVESLRKRYGEWNVSRFWGGNRETRELEEETFKTTPTCRFMVATAAAGGRGRTWTDADLTVYYSNTWDLDHREQSERRVQGVGKDRGILYVDLVARRRNGEPTVDERILHALRKKIDLASAITRDNWKSWVV